MGSTPENIQIRYFVFYRPPILVRNPSQEHFKNFKKCGRGSKARAKVPVALLAA